MLEEAEGKLGLDGEAMQKSFRSIINRKLSKFPLPQ